MVESVLCCRLSWKKFFGLRCRCRPQYSTVVVVVVVVAVAVAVVFQGLRLSTFVLGLRNRQ